MPSRTSSPKKRQKAFYELIERQNGLFTAKQAIRLGFDRRNHPYHVKRGNWLKLERGIYRLSRFPSSDDESYGLWTLWSCDREGNPQGTISHGSALELYDLSDYASKKIHLTVPKNFRRSAPPPKNLIIHRADLQLWDIQERNGYQVTTPCRTLADVILENEISPEFIEQAIAQAFQRGLIVGSDLDNLARRVAQVEITDKWSNYIRDVKKKTRCR